MRKRISPKRRAQVAERARRRCEYCHAAERLTLGWFHVDHAIPLSKGGLNKDPNLVFACPLCNDIKSDRTEAGDPLTGQTVPLFHPRRDAWAEHFIWNADGLEIIGLTPTGRATVAALRLNDPHRLYLRGLWQELHLHPPKDDPIASPS
jgi:hypothetical protein